MKIRRPEMLNKPKCNAMSCLFVVVCILIAAILLLNLWFTWEFLVVEVSGSSMETTLTSGDILYADRFKTPERGDIVIIDVSDRRGEEGFSGDFIVKRIIGLSGDTVKCEGEKIYLRGADSEEFIQLDESYLKTVYPNEDFEEVTVGEGEVFVLGDHRNNSKDSRYVGCLKVSRIVGVVPDWVVRFKGIIGTWESFRSGLGRRTTTHE